MKQPDSTGNDVQPAFDQYPEYELEYYLDREESPPTIILCSTESAGQIATEWISCRANYAVSVDAVR